MPGQYSKAHKPENLRGPGDARPSALQIIKYEGLEGKMTVVRWLPPGGKVFLTARDLKKGKVACKPSLEPARVELLKIDNNSLDSARAPAKALRGKSDKLNVIVNNAGIMAAPEGETADESESQFGTNHLAHFLFFCLVKDIMIASSIPQYQSRVVNVSSSGSKGLHSLALNPGGIWTGLQKFIPEETMKQWKARPNVENFLKSHEQGAATSVLAAVGNVYEGKGRLYLEDCDIAGATVDGDAGYTAHAFDEEKEKRLWKDSLSMVGLPEE
ncbi:MAG: hypothetical protein M1827_001482 [Pycnora praestabilis]|nr:MAG: hypothetical protein M1827_001482 [Pycnora praestabilis]